MRSDSNFVSYLEACTYCGYLQKEKFKFCTSCGKRSEQAVNKEKKSDLKIHKNLKSVVSYTVLIIVLLIVEALLGLSFETLLIWTVTFAIIDILYAQNQPQVWLLLKTKQLEIEAAISIFMICILTAFSVAYFADFTNQFFYGYVEDGYLQYFSEFENPLIYAIILIGIFPAFFEELAFRGFIYNNLEILGSKRSAIWGSAFLFSLVHFSIFSLLWLIPFSLIMTYYRNKYSTIIYGMIGHFTHNTTILLIEYYQIY